MSDVSTTEPATSDNGAGPSTAPPPAPPSAPARPEQPSPPEPESQEPTSQEPDSSTPELGFWGEAFGAAFLIAVGVAVGLANATSRTWLQEHWIWLVTLGPVVVVLAGVVRSRAWIRDRSAAVRAAIFLLVVGTVVILGAAAFFTRMPTTSQLSVMRAVVLLVLVITPALMWWLFLATQRASLLNEFLANLQRLGLLEPATAGDDQIESELARDTRVSSYLQRFEATYGRLPTTIHEEVVANRFKPYSTGEVRDQAPLVTTAVPVILSVVVLAVGWLIALPPINEFPADDTTTSPRWLLALSPNPTPATFAFLGAYFFSIQMLFRRYVRSDLRGSAFIAVVLRVVLAVIGAWVITAVAPADGWTSEWQLLLLGFAVGVFPMVLWQLIRGVASKHFLTSLPNLQSRLPLERLDGLTVWHEARLAEEDVENVPNMATADIVDLLVNTPFPATRIIDWIDQALLLTQLGPDEASNESPTSSRRRLARHGVRTASGLLKTRSDKQGQEREAFDSVLLDADGRPAVPSIVSSLQANTNLARVLHWRGLDDLCS